MVKIWYNYLQGGGIIISNNFFKKDRKTILKERIHKAVEIMAIIFIIFIISVNISSTVAEACARIPGFKGVVEKLRFFEDDYIQVYSALNQKINYYENKNGIEFKLNSISGDYKTIGINYELSDRDKYDLDLVIEGEGLEYTIFEEIPNGDKNSFEISISKFSPEVIMKFFVYENGEKKDSYTVKPRETFIVPVELEGFKNINLDNQEKDFVVEKVETPAGQLYFRSILRSGDKTGIKYMFTNDKYDDIFFVNPRLISKDGKEYKVFSQGRNDDNIKYSIQLFKGKLPLKEEVFLRYDGIQVKVKENMLKIDVSKGMVEDNPFGIEVASINGNNIKLRSKIVEHFSIEKPTGNIISSKDGEYSYNDISIDEAVEGIKIYDVTFKDQREVKLEINQWIMK